jgi:hypothetical protein
VSTGQTLLTIGAFILLSNILLTFYGLLAESGQTIDRSQSGITAVSLATTYSQLAHGLNFDERTISRYVEGSQIGELTPPDRLGTDLYYGPDSLGTDTLGTVPDLQPEDQGPGQMKYFDDFDDFNGFEIRDTSLLGGLGYYRTRFRVYYVDADNIDVFSFGQTLVKRMDIKIWREFPPSADTFRTSTVMGYWKFRN